MAATDGDHIMKTKNRSNGKRHPSVVVFSREHHYGLIFCSRMKRLLTMNVDLDFARMLFKSFWVHDLKPHAEAEEEWMNNFEITPAIQQVEIDHKSLTADFESIYELNLDELKDLLTRLEAHIRFEEKILFPKAGLMKPIRAF